jgi:retron-type reverse transcriptase
VKDDICELCKDFYNGEANLQSINSAYTTLVPKINSPASMNYFRPISLLNCVTKIVTKLLENRLQKVIIPLVHTNQYGFIKSRTIQNCLAWAFEYIYHCHHSKRQIVILKLDFTKAFDTIEHMTILQMMQQLGFSNRWMGWTKAILDFATTSILLNGVLGRNINCKRGIRQGDPLSPFSLC